MQARVANLIALKRAGDALRETLSSTSEDLEELARELSVKHRQLHTALEATEVAREQAEKANRVKAEFLALVSHELRTPLTTIGMNVELLSVARADAGQPAASGKVVERLTRATQQMSDLIEGLLHYTRIESGKLQVKLEKVDTVRLAEELVHSHKAGAAQGVELVFKPSLQAQEPVALIPACCAWC